MQADYPEIILASASGARAAILASAGIRFRQQPSTLDEREEHKCLASGISPSEVAKTLARLKADNVLEMEPGAIVIGADQVLAAGDEILQKPQNQEEARLQLQKLRGRTHELHSAAVVLQNGQAASFTDVATLRMRDFSDKFLDWYLETAGEGVLTSVGAYHIEGLGIHLFSEVKGDYFTILGLPIVPVLEQLRALSVILK
ncbi:MAG: septum formation protein Maf [Rhodomicrobium sp.]|nr:septum formation protein Maf [Rhodomicrobium sp.]